jgi:hypothetical protein
MVDRWIFFYWLAVAKREERLEAAQKQSREQVNGSKQRGITTDTRPPKMPILVKRILYDKETPATTRGTASYLFTSQVHIYQQAPR